MGISHRGDNLLYPSEGPMDRVTVRMSPSQRDWVWWYGIRNNMTISEVLRLLIDQAMASEHVATRDNE